mmetsp:Transcript_38837/g.38400  ORF Transcript_38837/g.38400 Transcript_38837/m.38400 type:complete len:224 (+) Transcript_38837:231-902(+)
MSMNETFVAEISNFLGIDRAEVREAIKGNEGDPLSKKVTALTKKLEEKYSKNKDDKEEEEKKEKVENDDGDEWFNLKNIEFEQDNNSTQGYGLNTDPKFSEIVDTLAAYDSGNYSLEADSEKNTQYNIYEKVYKKLNSDVESEYLKTLSFYYKQLCRKCISAFFQELNMKEVLKLVQETSGSLDKFMSYILIKGNEAAMTMHNTKETKQLEEFEALISKLIKT